MIAKVQERTPMDTMEFRRILEVSDRELEQAKREWEAKARREQQEQRKRILLHWKQGIEARKTEFAKYGAKPSIDLDGKLAEIQREIDEIDGQVSSKEPAPPPAPRVFTLSQRAEVAQLIDEVESGAGILDLPVAERLLKVQEWSVRWKMLWLQAGGEDIVEREPIFKAAYAVIMKMRDAAAGKDTPLPALSRTPGTMEGWTATLADLRARQAQAARAREEQEHFEKASDEAFAELNVFLQSAAVEGDEALRTFRHLVRRAASWPHLREEVASLCSARRQLLEPEFSFLWEQPKDDEPEEPSKKLTNRMVVARICRRLKSKDMIGACHAPQDLVTQGFAGHDYGRAEEAMDVLVKGGLVRRRKTGIGVRVSLEPAMMQATEAAIEGKPTGISSVDEWTSKEAS